ncbi:MAG: MFS transporter [Coriobacteriia bacterium]|nr:MFS transporter [Coriobacteriia bacterium]MCL2750755.1 MFS transporter [Coriobacteriia bacterium]
MASQTRIKNNYFDGLKVTRIHFLLFLTMMLAYFFEQMDNWNFGFIAPVLFTNWGFAPTELAAEIAKVTFPYFLGMTFGGLLGGVISDFIGRRKTFLGAILIFSIGSILNGFVPVGDLTLLIITRASTGFGIFMMMVCSQTFIAEMSPADSRGKWQGRVAAVGFCAAPLVGLFCLLVLPVGAGTAAFVQGWRIVFWAGGLGLLAFFVGLKYIKESPRWLVSKGKIDEAEQIMLEITGQDIDLSDAAKLLPPKVKVIDVLVGMFSLKYLKRTVVLLLFMGISTPATFVITNWTTAALTQNINGAINNDVASAFLSSGMNFPVLITLIMQIGVPFGLLINSFISDKLYRKYPLAIMLIITGILATCFGLYFSSLDLSVFGVGELIAVCVLGFCMTAGVMCAGFMGFSYVAESYPTRMRNTATGVHNAVARFATSGFQMVIPVIMTATAATGGFLGLGLAGFSGLFITVAVLLTVPAIIVIALGMRTGGKSLEEIS